MKSKTRSSPISNLKWLIPGMGVKRWLALLAFGVTLMGLGAVYFIVVLYRGGILPRGLYRVLTLQFLSPWGRIGAAVILSLAAIGLALYQLGKSTLTPFLQTGGVPLADAVYHHRRLEQGPRIVVIGGGHGLSTLLRGLKEHTSNITAIITVADDGGSSGRLRRELNLPPPGDFRNCIAALSNDEALTTQLLQYRFGFSMNGKKGSNGELAGHSFGNLYIAAMTGITGSFEKGLEHTSQVLAIQGQILPSTLADVTLVADVREQSSQVGELHRVAGESQIPKTDGLIEQVYLIPEHAPAYPAAVRAILTAQLVVLGPGSLYTSILPNLLVRGIRQALNTTPAQVIYVCNVANQSGETDNFDTAEYVQALEHHIGRGIIDSVLANNAIPDNGNSSSTKFVQPVKLGHVQMVTRDLIDKSVPWQHNSKKLAKAVLSFIKRER